MVTGVAPATNPCGGARRRSLRSRHKLLNDATKCSGGVYAHPDDNGVLGAANIGQR
jgi:hypothetical protein